MSSSTELLISKWDLLFAYTQVPGIRSKMCNQQAHDKTKKILGVDEWFYNRII
jgi:hypothetical protein